MQSWQNREVGAHQPSLPGAKPGKDKRHELINAELAREVLRGAALDDLQSLFADEMCVSNSPMGCPKEISPVLIPVKTWLDWALEHQATQRRSTGKRRAVVQPGQLSIWDTLED